MTTPPRRSGVLVIALLFAGLLMAAALVVLPSSRPRAGLVMVVMDPLSSRLACACVKGYAQRDYDRLATHLTARLGLPVKAVFAESLDKALRVDPAERVALIVGKHSVVKADARLAACPVQPIARLTGADGSTTLTGLFIVRRDDPAESLGDLKGRPILLGPADSDEKHAAALAALKVAGVAPPAKLETRSACTDAAVEVQDGTGRSGPVGVISSYAMPLLEGCGSVEPGSLRVLGRTEPVPFITAFAVGALGAQWETRLTDALLSIDQDSSLLTAMESKLGFVPAKDETAEWPGWRGPNRDGQASWLPARLPATPKLAWTRPMVAPVLAGLAVAEGMVVAADRDLLDTQDVFLGLRAADGETVWRLEYPAAGKLDYGPSPRATPTIRAGRAYLLGAFGALHCVELATGKVLWKRDLGRDFAAKPPKWGWCSAPLIVDEKLIINPGAPGASVVALNRFTGEVIWKTRGGPAAYAAFICGRFGGRQQIVGYDAQSLGGWDPQTGRRLWTLVPPSTGDFNVPTPIEVGDRLLVATENNATRLYGFREDGTIIPQPLAAESSLAPDTSTPVILDGQVVGCSSGLHALDLAQHLKPVWHSEDDAFVDFATLMAGSGRILAVTFRGELFLLGRNGSALEVTSKLRLFENDSEMYSHPALAGHRLFVRDRGSVGCLDLEDESAPGLAAALGNDP